MKRLALLLHLALCCALPLTAEEPLPLEEEAPEAIFEAEIGSGEVDFFLTGSWTASLTSSYGWLFGLDGGPAPASVPGLESEGLFVFKQIPDLMFSVWLEERYFLETTVTSGDFEDFFQENTLRMGYQGKEDEFLKHLYISNRDIGISPYPYLEVPGTGESSLGAEALLGSGEARHELLLRSDNNEAGEVVYIGGNLVSEREVALNEYIRGRFFKLPDRQVEDLVVYIEDPYGSVTGTDADGRSYKYRRAALEDAFLDAEGGLVTLAEAAAGRVVVYYEKGVAEVGDASLGSGALCATASGKLDPTGIPLDFDWGVLGYLGQDMADRQVTIEGKTALRLYMPGEFSPFEILASYALDEAMPEDLSRLRVTIIPAGDADGSAPAHVIRFRLLPDADYVGAYLDGDVRGNFRNLYPFLDSGDTEIFDPENLLYGPEAEPAEGYLRYALLVSRLTPVEEYRLGGDLVPGSVRVKRNGAEETRFEMDYDTGILTFLTYIHPDDRLEISFRRRQSLLNNTDLLFAWGNFLPLRENLSLELAAGLRWNILPGGYTEEAYSRTGTLIASTALKGEGEKLSFRAEGAVSYSNPDTTGIMRLAGMEGRGIQIALSEDTAYPAAEPVVSPGAGFTARGELYYKDYRSYDLLGYTLMPYDNQGYHDVPWSPPPDQVFAYEPGSKIGPYLAAGSSQGRDEGQCLVLDFDLDEGEYVGTQIPVAAGLGLMDLSGLESAVLSYRTIEVTSGVTDLKLYLQIGETGEDLDGDAVLDEEPSSSSAGFRFNYAGADYLLVGGGPKNQGNNRRDTEDVDGSGQLDNEDPSLTGDNIYTAPDRSVADGDDVWKVASFSLAGFGDRLRRVRAVRLLVVDQGTAGSGTSGRILIDGLRLAGSAFWGKEDAFGSLEIREVTESAAAWPPAKELADAFSRVDEVFHPLGERQEVLEIAWTAAAGTDAERSVRGLTGAASGGADYRTINLYYRLPDITLGVDDRIEFALLDSAGKGVRWGFTAQTQDPWALIEVDLDANKVLLNGTEPAGAFVSADAGRGSLSRLEVVLPDGSDGTVYLDELHLTEPRGEVGGAFALDAELLLPGTLISVGEHPLVHDLRLKEAADFRSEGFASLYGEPAQVTGFSSYSEADVGISVTDLRVDLLVAGNAGSSPDLSGGHRLLLPNVPFPLSFTDAYSVRETAAGRSLYRANTLRLSIPAAGTVSLDSQADSGGGLLTQSWDLDLKATNLTPVLPGASLSLRSSRDGYKPAEEGYFASWVRDYRLLAPRDEGEPLERKTGLDLSVGVDTRPLSFDLGVGTNSRSFDFLTSPETRSQESSLEAEIAFPWSPGSEDGKRRLTLTTGYRREVRVVDTESGAGDFGADVKVCFDRLREQGYFFSQAPFVELYSERTQELFLTDAADLQEAAYSCESTFALSRPFSSRLRDLWLPSYLELAVGRELELAGAADEDINTYSLDLRANALNLFGEYGAYPLFDFYRTDSYSAGLGVEVRVDHDVWRPGATAGLREASLLLEHFLSLEGASGASLTLDNRFRAELAEAAENPHALYSNTLGLLYLWTRTPEKAVKLRFLKPESKPYWNHLESLEYEFNREEKVLSYHPLNLIIRHESSLVFPDSGYLKAAFSLGLDRERLDGGGSLWRLGFRGGIEAQIMF